VSAAGVLGLRARAEPPTFKEALVLPPVGSAARAVIVADAEATSLVAGNWTAPKAGEVVTLPDGSKKAWEAVEVGADGWLKHPSLRGGYAYVPVTSDVEQIQILEAAGHGLVYVNGEPRAGDPYQTNYVHVPVLLKKGINDLLFRGGRGDMRMGFKPAEAAVYIDPADVTIPDVAEGAAGPMLGSILVINATNQWVRGSSIIVAVEGGKETPEAIEPMPPLSVRKAAFAFEVATKPGQPDVKLALRVAVPEELKRTPEAKPLPLTLRVRKAGESRKVTFRSGIDGSVQYYGLRVAVPADGKVEGQSLILSLHGASVEAIGQADAYSSKPWASIVCPTNRRPYGFDWEDWGRLDAIEVLEQSEGMLKPDPHRVYLTGHSMGGHGTWQVGAHFAGRFAAIAPSAGWISFASYAGAEEYKGGSPIEGILRRAAATSDTLSMLHNYSGIGVYILHGDADDNVPVEQARQMRSRLGEFHPDFVYYERPGANHWWGNQCVDWPPLMEFLHERTIPEQRDVRKIDFATANPGVCGQYSWASIEAQVRPLLISTIKLSVKPEARTFSGSTQNVSRLTLDLTSFAATRPVEKEGKTVDEPVLEPGKPLTIELDQQKLTDVPWPTAQPRLTLYREGDQWRVGGWAPATLKGPHRNGTFKDAFRNNMLFVVGTGGTDEEKNWAQSRARYDAEAFWYRGNGSIQIVRDSEFDAAKDPTRNVILYGNADTNSAWKALLADSPIRVNAGQVKIGDKVFSGVDLACLFIRPRPGSEKASVGVVSGTGPIGMRASFRIPYFISGVGLPDWIVVGPESTEKGVGGVRGTGFFGNDWGLSAEDTAWPVEAQPPSASK
jgi:dienelactone hydrolase